MMFLYILYFNLPDSIGNKGGKPEDCFTDNGDEADEEDTQQVNTGPLPHTTHTKGSQHHY